MLPTLADRGYRLALISNADEDDPVIRVIREAGLPVEFEAVVTNTTKPVVFIGYSARGVELVYEMAAEVAGGVTSRRSRSTMRRRSSSTRC